MSVYIDWREHAACQGTDPAVFFPTPVRVGHGGMVCDYSRAKAICDRCPVAGECLEDALRDPVVRLADRLSGANGMRGGMTADERQKEIRRRRRNGTMTIRTSSPCGTASRYRAGCRCVPCREAHNVWAREYRRTHRAELSAAKAARRLRQTG